MSSLRRPFLALTLFCVLYVFLALLGIGPGSDGLRSALLGIREDPLWGSTDPPNELKIKLRVQDIRLQRYNITVQNHMVNCYESPWVLRSSYSREVLILHASVQPLAVWEDTLRLLTTWGHRAVAVQLPGWGGRDQSPLVSPERRGSFLAALLEKTQFTTPAVLVAPCLGGLFALPFLREYQGKATALIGISISVPADCKPHDLQKIQIPGLAIYTEGDSSAGRIARLLTSAPLLTVRTVATAKETANSPLLPNPSAIHRILYYFLLNLHRKPQDS